MELDKFVEEYNKGNIVLDKKEEGNNTSENKKSGAFDFKRGQVYNINLGLPEEDDTIGSETNKIRPCVVVSNNVGNKMSGNIIVIPIMHSKSSLPTHVYIPRQPFANIEGVAKAENIRDISKERVISFVCELPVHIMRLVDRAISIATGMEYSRELKVASSYLYKWDNLDEAIESEVKRRLRSNSQSSLNEAKESTNETLGITEIRNEFSETFLSAKEHINKLNNLCNLLLGLSADKDKIENGILQVDGSDLQSCSSKTVVDQVRKLVVDDIDSRAKELEEKILSFIKRRDEEDFSEKKVEDIAENTATAEVPSSATNTQTKKPNCENSKISMTQNIINLYGAEILRKRISCNQTVSDLAKEYHVSIGSMSAILKKLNSTK